MKIGIGNQKKKTKKNKKMNDNKDQKSFYITEKQINQISNILNELPIREFSKAKAIIEVLNQSIKGEDLKNI